MHPKDSKKGKCEGPRLQVDSNTVFKYWCSNKSAVSKDVWLMMLWNVEDNHGLQQKQCESIYDIG